MLWAEISCHFATWGLNHLLAVVGASLFAPLYYWAYSQQQYDLVWLGWFGYLLAFLLFDFLYYWFHRTSHYFTVLWWVHSVHHQVTFLTPALALRVSAFDFAVIWIILLPMLLMGFSREHLVFVLSLHAFYQVFLHLRWKVSLGPLEWLFNSPAHHALHHAKNRPYLDKNFASVLIVWDKLFGSFVAVQPGEQPKIGVVGRNDSTNPLLTNLAPMLVSFHVVLPKQQGWVWLNVLIFLFALLVVAADWQSSVWPFIGILAALVLHLWYRRE